MFEGSTIVLLASNPTNIKFEKPLALSKYRNPATQFHVLEFNSIYCNGGHSHFSFWCKKCGDECHWPMECGDYRGWQKKWEAQFELETAREQNKCKDTPEHAELLHIKCSCKKGKFHVSSCYNFYYIKNLVKHFNIISSWHRNVLNFTKCNNVFVTLWRAKNIENFSAVNSKNHDHINAQWSWIKKDKTI